MHKLLRYANNVLRYAAIITLCVVITLCGVTSESRRLSIVFTCTNSRFLSTLFIY